MDPVEELFKKLVTNAKPKKEVDHLEQAVRGAIKNVQRKEKEKKGAQNGAGYDYVKVWDDEGIGYRMVPLARVRMSEILGRPIKDEERVFLINRKLVGPAKYHASNLLLGDRHGIRLDLLVCKHCGTQGQVKGSHA